MTAFTSKWLLPSVSSVSPIPTHVEENEGAFVSFGSGVATHVEKVETGQASRVMTYGMPFQSIISVGNKETSAGNPCAQEKPTAKTDRSPEDRDETSIAYEIGTDKADKSTHAGADTLVRLRGAGISVTVDGDNVRCRVPKGLLTTALAAELKEQKSAVLDLLNAEDEEIAWRLDSIAADLLVEPAELMPGACSYCGSKMPYQQTGKCTLCCLATAKLVVKSLDAVGLIGHTTYPVVDVAPEESKLKMGLCDMSPVGVTR